MLGILDYSRIPNLQPSVSKQLIQDELLIGVAIYAIIKLDIGAPGKSNRDSIGHVKTFIQIDLRAEGAGRRIVDPILGIGPITIK